MLGNNVGVASGEAMWRKEVEVIEIKGGRGILYLMNGDLGRGEWK